MSMVARLEAEWIARLSCSNSSLGLNGKHLNVSEDAQPCIFRLHRITMYIMFDAPPFNHRAAEIRPSNGGDMFTNLTTLVKIPLVTTDGEEYQVCSLLFDDRSWTICFLVVDAGSCSAAGG